MRSIRDAITTATRASLSQYLAPELVQQLTEEIIHRAAPEMEEALRAMAGFELGRPNPRQTKPQGAAAPKSGKRGRPSQVSEPVGVPLYSGAQGESHNGSPPAVAPMDMI